MIFRTLQLVAFLPLVHSYSIQVCSNKDCCKRFQGKVFDLHETLEQILPASVKVESTGCLSQCGHGPNLCRHKDDGSEEFLYGVIDAGVAVAALNLADPDLKIHPTLLAAVNVMEKTEKVSTVDEKDRFLSSVINALTKNQELQSSIAMANARVFRAQLFLENGRLEEARDDATRAAEIHPFHPTAYRILADIEEADNRPDYAIEALSKWGQVHPSFQTKVANEIARLRGKHP